MIVQGSSETASRALNIWLRGCNLKTDKTMQPCRATGSFAKAASIKESCNSLLRNHLFQKNSLFSISSQNPFWCLLSTGAKVECTRRQRTYSLPQHPLSPAWRSLGKILISISGLLNSCPSPTPWIQLFATFPGSRMPSKRQALGSFRSRTVS